MGARSLRMVLIFSAPSPSRLLDSITLEVNGKECPVISGITEEGEVLWTDYALTSAERYVNLAIKGPTANSDDCADQLRLRRVEVFSIEHGALGAEAARISVQVIDLQAKLSRCEAQRTDDRKAFEASLLTIRTSCSWRLTAPLRALSALVKR